MNKLVFRNLTYGLYAVTTLDGQRKTGCIANSAMQITSTPATVALSMNHNNYTNFCIKKSGLFALSILSEQSDPGIIGQFGFQSGKDINKFDTVAYELKSGIPVITDSCGYIVCKVVDQMETNTHTVFLGEVIDGDILSDTTPMTYSYYHNVIKGKSPKNAPTYLPDETTAQDESQVRYVCSVCGYVYDGDIPFEELPDDYKCPLCHMPKDKFVKEIY